MARIYACKDMAGQRIGMMTVLERVARPEGVSGRSARWLCKCDCGRKTIVTRANLVQRRTSSCGCIKRRHAGTMARARWDKRGARQTAQ